MKQAALRTGRLLSRRTCDSYEASEHFVRQSRENQTSRVILRSSTKEFDIRATAIQEPPSCFLTVVSGSGAASPEQTAKQIFAGKEVPQFVGHFVVGLEKLAAINRLAVVDPMKIVCNDGVYTFRVLRVRCVHCNSSILKRHQRLSSRAGAFDDNR